MSAGAPWPATSSRPVGAIAHLDDDLDGMDRDDLADLLARAEAGQAALSRWVEGTRVYLGGTGISPAFASRSTNAATSDRGQCGNSKPEGSSLTSATMSSRSVAMGALPTLCRQTSMCGPGPVAWPSTSTTSQPPKRGAVWS